MTQNATSLQMTPNLSSELHTSESSCLQDIPLLFVRGTSLLACSKRLLTFLSRAVLPSFFFLGKCLRQSFSYSSQKPGPQLSVPSFSHISHPINAQILSAVLSQYVWDLTTFQCLMSITLVQTAPLCFLTDSIGSLLASSLALPNLFSTY